MVKSFISTALLEVILLTLDIFVFQYQKIAFPYDRLKKSAFGIAEIKYEHEVITVGRLLSVIVISCQII